MDPERRAASSDGRRSDAAAERATGLDGAPRPVVVATVLAGRELRPRVAALVVNGVTDHGCIRRRPAGWLAVFAWAAPCLLSLPLCRVAFPVPPAFSPPPLLVASAWSGRGEGSGSGGDGSGVSEGRGERQRRAAAEGADAFAQHSDKLANGKKHAPQTRGATR